MPEPILRVKDLNKEFKTKSTKLFSKSVPVKILKDISFDLLEGETLSVVGESGSGKTTLGRCVLNGLDATSGEVVYVTNDEKAVDYLNLGKADYKKYRKDIQMIFQDPYSSLNPRMTVFDIISEPLVTNYDVKKKEVEEHVADIAERVGLNPHLLKRYPHAFSGGQRQRIAIARALITQPRVIVCDEAVSALDVSIQAQIINLLDDLQTEMGITYIFISHDLSVVQTISDRVAVMHLGRIVELASVDSFFENPKHPYSEALLSSVPKPDPDVKTDRIILQGEVPNPGNPPSGCEFHPRCPYATELCRTEIPELKETGQGKRHLSACHYADELELRGVWHANQAK
ncbi:oligopeptide/dipeptide ABC transporter ATPase [Gracilibacillus halophilus YIM-C55.5]|uniref:Oligopeptide/dipeptide ABC transporter ATPase n=1 Tax=Gracilibacillus halophilus YIM-C55.5 TaxID=1308866 RepID=N4W9B2_9BACI|nr:oligopeptide/dipeptide ABC transporter ATP-binding protein [Gracilibacillus halophilus]ENH96873.1 oligopeptide/dipeptide ABC transporter ATPase [Gracilibacillus halophilus YIM-C55.5]